MAAQELTMTKDDQWEVWDPFGGHGDKLTGDQRADMERGAAWSRYINGGVGDPRDFDFMTWSRNAGKQAGREDEQERKTQSQGP
jgi:hypothetical protein